MAVQWLELHTLTAEGLGSIPSQGNKIPHKLRSGAKIIIIMRRRNINEGMSS